MDEAIAAPSVVAAARSACGHVFFTSEGHFSFAVVSKKLFPTMLDRFNWERVLNEYLNEVRNTLRSLEVQINLLL